MHHPDNHRGQQFSQNMGQGQGQYHLGQTYSEQVLSPSFSCNEQASRQWTHKNNAKSATQTQTNPYPRPNNQQGQYVSHNQQHSVTGYWNTMDQEDVVRLSKTLAFLLRHGAKKLGFQFMPGGFLYVDEILWYHKPLWNFTVEQIRQVVRTNDKQQFALQEDDKGRLMIRANQGHTTADQADVVRLSKTLAFLLRHGAEKLGFQFMPGGFLYVDELLWYHKPLWNFTEDQICEVVRTNNKQRFALQEDDDGRLMIRANQGHTTAVEGLDLTPIYDSSEVHKVIHGTYYQAWEQIRRTGLSRMNRIHIHFAAGMPGKSGVISGMRKSCEVVIEIDLEKAMKAGIPFFRSANNVILSPGNEKGFIPSTFFKSAFDRHSGQPLPMDFSRCESSFGQDTSSPSDHVTGERRNQQDPVKRKSKDQSKDQPDRKRAKRDMPELGSHKPRAEKDRKTSKFDESQRKETMKCCKPQQETGKETTKQETGGHPDQIDHELRYGHWQDNEDKSKDDKRAGTMSKSQNKKEK